MSVQGDIFAFLQTHEPGERGYVPMTSPQMAIQGGWNRDRVNSVLFSLMTSGRIELIRGSNGRNIIGYKVLEPHRQVRQAPTPRAELVSTRRVPTPHLDAYIAAKAKFDHLVADLGPLVHAEFSEDPYAEEGLRLLDRLNRIEPQFGDLRRELDEAQRDLRHLRGRVRSEMAASAVSEGATIVNGD